MSAPASTIYRGDVLRLLTATGKFMPPHIAARLCGFDYEPPSKPEPSKEENDRHDTKPVPSETRAQVSKQHQRPQYEFWHVAEHHQESESEAAERERPPEAIERATAFQRGDLTYDLKQCLRGRPLLHWSRLWPFLREVLGRHKPGRQPDLQRVLHLLARGRALQRLPRKERRGWHPEVFILRDRRPEMAPFWDDYDYVIKRLKRARGTSGLHYKPQVDLTAKPHCDPCGDPDSPLGHLLDCSLTPWQRRLKRSPNAAVLVLGDLHQYDAIGEQEKWLAFGRQLRRRGLTPWALCPCPRDRWSGRLAHVWNIAAWDRGLRLTAESRGQHAEAAQDEQRQVQMKAIFALLAPAVLVERGLLRDLRFLLPHSEADVGTEYDVFNDMPSGFNQGFTIPSDQLRELRSKLPQMPMPQLKLVLQTLHRHHQYCQKTLGQWELIALRDVLPSARWQELIQAGLVSDAALQRAWEYWANLIKTAWSPPAGMEAEPLKDFFAGDLERLQSQAFENRLLQDAWGVAHQGEDKPLPPWVREENIRWAQPANQLSRKHEVWLTSEGIRLGGPRARSGCFLLGIIASRWQTVFASGPMGRMQLNWGSLLQLPDELKSASLGITSDRETLTLSTLQRPRWASEIRYDQNGLFALADMGGARCRFKWVTGRELPADGIFNPFIDSPPDSNVGLWHPESRPKWAHRMWVDKFGIAAGFIVGNIPFVLRWIPPGSFLMGSPEDEAGRYDWEGPQHEVTISKGYWLGETPVTQAQWRAVVEAGKAERGLLEALFGRGKKGELKAKPSHFKGPDSLPVESVTWHDSRRYCELLTGVMKAPELQFHLPTEAQWEYACRAGTESAFNDGSACTLPTGKDPALDKLGWFNENSGQKTHPAKEKNQPNAWGLHDMHGNVWEWCRDAWDEKAYAKRSGGVTDPETTNDDEIAVRVMRGGSWVARARYCRSAYRGRGLPGDVWRNLGLRLAAGQNEPSAAEPPERSDLPERRSRARRAGGSGPA